MSAVTPPAMEPVHELLVQRALHIRAAAQRRTPGARVVVAFSGPPGSGKSTVAARVVQLINDRAGGHIPSKLAVLVPMDGFHYPRAYLDQLPNSTEAHLRRGAHWTFDGLAFVALVKTLCASPPDRAGRPIATLVNDTWFIDVDPALARTRIARRHLAAGIEPTWAAALERVDKNDTLNGEDIRRHLVRATKK